MRTRVQVRAVEMRRQRRRRRLDFSKGRRMRPIRVLRNTRTTARRVAMWRIISKRSMSAGRPKRRWKRMRWPLDDTGRNSVRP